MIYSVVKNNMQYVKIALIYFLLFYHTQTFSLFLIQQPKLSFSNISQNLVIALLKPLLRFFSYSDSESSPLFPLPTCSGPVPLLWLSSSTLLYPAPITPAFSSVHRGFSLTVSFTRALPLEVLTAGASHPSHLSPNIIFQWPQPLSIVCILAEYLHPHPSPFPGIFFLFLFYGCAAWHDQGSNLHPSALQAWSLNHWITREVLPRHFLFHFLAYLFFTPSPLFATGYTFFFIGLWPVSLF